MGKENNKELTKEDFDILMEYVGSFRDNYHSTAKLAVDLIKRNVELTEKLHKANYEKENLINWIDSYRSLSQNLEKAHSKLFQELEDLKNEKEKTD